MLRFVLTNSEGRVIAERLAPGLRARSRAPDIIEYDGMFFVIGQQSTDSDEIVYRTAWRMTW